MGKNTAWGNNAYKETRSNGGSKSEAKQASSEATERYHQHTQERQFGNCKSHNSNESDFNSEINGSGTNWHTSEDL
jgi:hypothetical protein